MERKKTMGGMGRAEIREGGEFRGAWKQMCDTHKC